MNQEDLELTLFRHGETIANARGEWQGSSDSALTESGKTMVIEAARSLIPKQIDIILHSGKGRSIRTAEIISDIIGVPELKEYDLLRDRDLGAADGLTSAKIMEVFGVKFTNILDDTIDLLPGAESVEELKNRVEKARNNLFTDFKGKNVLAISHGGFIRMFYKTYIGDPHSIRLTNCSFIRVKMSRNETVHLDKNVTYL